MNRAAGEVYPVLPLRDIVVFPHMIVPLFVGRERSVKALEDVMKEDKQILLIAQKNAADDDPVREDIYRVGTIATVLQLLKLPDGTVKVLVEGEARARVIRFTENDNYYEVYADILSEQLGPDEELEALSRSVIAQFEKYIKLNKKVPTEALASINQIEEPGKLVDTVASHISLKISEKQELLEIDELAERMERVIAFMEAEIGVLRVEKKIRTRVKRQMEKTQREYYLNEQMKAIQKELGETEEGKDETQELEEKINKTKLSKEAREKALTELKKLRNMSPMSAEATVVRNYLDWMVSIPWRKQTKIEKDINKETNLTIFDSSTQIKDDQKVKDDQKEKFQIEDGFQLNEPTQFKITEDFSNTSEYYQAHNYEKFVSLNLDSNNHNNYLSKNNIFENLGVEKQFISSLLELIGEEKVEKQRYQVKENINQMDNLPKNKILNNFDLIDKSLENLLLNLSYNINQELFKANLIKKMISKDSFDYLVGKNLMIKHPYPFIINFELNLNRPLLNGNNLPSIIFININCFIAGSWSIIHTCNCND